MFGAEFLVEWCHALLLLLLLLLLLVTKTLKSYQLIKCLILIISILSEHKQLFPLIRKPHVHQPLICIKILLLYHC